VALNPLCWLTVRSGVDTLMAISATISRFPLVVTGARSQRVDRVGKSLERDREGCMNTGPILQNGPTGGACRSSRRHARVTLRCHHGV